VYRVVTKYRNGSSHPVVERGPWHTSRETAEDWADSLRMHGYIVFIETQNGLIDGGMGGGGGGGDDNADLLAALSSMA